MQEQITEINQLIEINENQISRMKEDEKSLIQDHAKTERIFRDRRERVLIL